MAVKIAVYTLLLACWVNNIKAQTFDYNDTILHKGGEYFYIGLFKIYGQYRIDSSFAFPDKLKSWDGVNEFTNKIPYGRCFYFHSLRMTNSNGKMHPGDSTKIKMIIDYDNRGNPLRTVFLNADGTVQYIYVEKA